MAKLFLIIGAFSKATSFDFDGLNLANHENNDISISEPLFRCWELFCPAMSSDRK